MNFPFVYLLVYILWIGGFTSTARGNTGLLDNTLFTFQTHACEEEKLRVRCPYGTTIKIQWAQFGRLLPSEEICPFSNYQFRFSQEKGKTKTENTQCLSSTALQIVLDQCQDRRQCKLLASTTVFGDDPCPETSKYLEVQYKCRPNAFRSRVVCEEDQLQLRCTTSQRLAIYSATFGWSQHSQWASQCASYAPPHSSDCDSPCAYGHVYSRCHGRKKCNVMALENNFQSTCSPSTPKYLMVIYTCVPKRILKDIDEDREYPDPCDEAAEEAEDYDDGTEDIDDTDNYDYNANPDNGDHPSNGNLGPDNGDTDVAPEIDGQPSYLPKTSTIDYNYVFTPHPELHPDNGGNNAPGEGQGVPEGEPEGTGEPNVDAVHEGVAGFVSDWIFTWNFISENTEKFILYISVGLCVGIICVLLVIIIRINQLRRRGKREAKLNISEPIANSSVVQPPETTSLLEPSDQSDGVEMTSYNQIGSMHRPPVSSFTDPYEEETPISYPTGSSGRENPHATFGRSTQPGEEETFIANKPQSISRNNHNHHAPSNGNGGGDTFTGSLSRPNHSRQTSFTGSLGRNTQPGTLTGSLNRRDHWTNEYRKDGHSHTLQHYYG